MDSDESKNTPETEPAEATAAATQVEEEKEEKIPFEILEKIPQEGSVVHYKLSVPREALSDRMEKMMKELRTSATIEGFRKGKAPRKLLEIRYGKEVKEDAVKEVAANVGEQIIENEKLELVVEGDLHSWTAEENNPLELVIQFELRPQIDAIGYDSLEVEVEEQVVTDEMVERRIEQLREANAQFKSAGEGAKFNPGDGAVIDYQVLDEKGNPLERYSVKDSFEREPMARVPKEIAEKMAGMAVGETVEAQVQNTHQTRQGAERTTTETHRLTLREVKVKEMPALDDDFAKDLGEFNTIGELRDRIRKDLDGRAEQLMRESALAKVTDKLIEANPFDAPRSVVAASTVQMVRQQTQRLAYAGVNLNALGEDAQRHYIEATRQDAMKSVKRDFLLANIAKKENIEVTEDDVNQAIERIAEAEGRRALAIRARIERENRLDELKEDLLVGKVNDLLLSKTKINKVKPAPAPETKEQPSEG